MSDFAPFVAAALKDKAVYDLLQENARLEQNASKAQAVEIRSGGRLCAKGNMKDGKYYDSGREETMWSVKLEKQMDNMTIEAIGNLEVYVGGILVARSSRHTIVYNLNSYKQDRNTGQFLIPMEDGAGLFVSVGPFTSLEHYHSTGGLFGEDPPPGMKVALLAVRFGLGKVQGLLDNLGVPPRSASDLRAGAQKLLASVSTGRLPNDVAERRRRRANHLLELAREAEQNGNNEKDETGE